MLLRASASSSFRPQAAAVSQSYRMSCQNVYEVQTRICPQMMSKGWQPSSVLNVGEGLCGDRCHEESAASENVPCRLLPERLVMSWAPVQPRWLEQM